MSEKKSMTEIMKKYCVAGGPEMFPLIKKDFITVNDQDEYEISSVALDYEVELGLSKFRYETMVFLNGESVKRYRTNDKSDLLKNHQLIVNELMG